VQVVGVESPVEWFGCVVVALFDGIHVNIRLDEESLCLLVLIGVHVDGTKELSRPSLCSSSPTAPTTAVTKITDGLDEFKNGMLVERTSTPGRAQADAA
jgi:hypothetical protein